MNNWDKAQSLGGPISLKGEEDFVTALLMYKIYVEEREMFLLNTYALLSTFEAATLRCQIIESTCLFGT